MENREPLTCIAGKYGACAMEWQVEKEAVAKASKSNGTIKSMPRGASTAGKGRWIKRKLCLVSI
jgi:hypothetical protein